MVRKNNTFPKHRIKVLILAGGHDFGRCSLASRLPTALWPVAGRASLENLLVHLADQGIKHVVILPGQNKSMFNESLHIDNRLKVEYLYESLPVGTAGSIREAAKNEEKSLFVLLPSSMVCPPDIDLLISEHIKGKADLTVVLETVYSESCGSERQASGIFICDTSVLKFIPEDGYSDIKEGLIPKMLQAGKNVHAVTLSCQAGSFRDCHEYLRAVSNNIKSVIENNNLKLCENHNSCTLWTGTGVRIDPSARIAGQVVLMDGVEISEGAVVIGSSVIGENVTIGKNSFIVNSIVWNNATIGDNCSIEHSVLDYNANLCSHANIIEQCKVSKPEKTEKKIKLQFPVYSKKQLESISANTC